MYCLTPGIPSEKCFVRQLRRREDIIGCIYMNQDGITYYTPSLCGIADGSQATSLRTVLLYNTGLNQAQEKAMESRDIVNTRYTRLLLA